MISTRRSTQRPGSGRYAILFACALIAAIGARPAFATPNPQGGSSSKPDPASAKLDAHTASKAAQREAAQMGTYTPTKESQKAFKKWQKAQAALEKAQRPTRSQKAAAKQQIAKLTPKEKQVKADADKMWKNGEHGQPYIQYHNAWAKLANTIAELKKTSKPLATKDFDNLIAAAPSIVPAASVDQPRKRSTSSQVANHQYNVYQASKVANKPQVASKSKAATKSEGANSEDANSQNSRERSGSQSSSSSSRASRQRSTSRSGE